MLYVVIGIILLILLWIIVKRNGFASQLDKIKNSRSDVLNIRDRLTQSINASIKIAKAGHTAEIEGIEKLNSGEQINALSVLMENSPNLKSSAMFAQTQAESYRLHKELDAQRRLLNSNVRLYNKDISMFPNIIVSKIFGYTKEDFIAEERLDESGELGSFQLKL